MTKAYDEYTVTIETAHSPVTLCFYAKDRDDAIAFAKTNNKARFHRKEYKRVISARRATPEVSGVAHAAG